MLKLKLERGDLWSVVSQKRHHQTLKEKTGVTISLRRVKLQADTILTGTPEPM